MHEYFFCLEFGFILIEVTLGQFLSDWIVLSCAEVFCCASCKLILAKQQQCPSILMENYFCWISMEKSTHRKEPSVKMMRWDKWETSGPTSSSLPSWESSLLPEHRLQYQITSAHHLTQKKKKRNPLTQLAGLQFRIIATAFITECAYFKYFSSPRAKRVGPKGLRAESARAVTGRRCPQGKDFWRVNQVFFYLISKRPHGNPKSLAWN